MVAISHTRCRDPCGDMDRRWGDLSEKHSRQRTAANDYKSGYIHCRIHCHSHTAD